MNAIYTRDGATTYNSPTWGDEGSAPAITSISASQTSDYTISTNTGIEEIFLIDSGASINVNLPSAGTVGAGYKYNIKNLSSSYTLTVNAHSTETIDSTLTYQLNVQFQSLTIVSDGASSWYIL